MRTKKRGNLQPNKSSVILNLKPILTARNIIHPTAFLIKMGINNATANKMLKGNAVQINFKQLTLLCLNLNCTPNDLFVLRDMQLSQNHQLNNLRKMEDEIVNPFEQSKKMSLEEINKMIEE